MLHTPQQFTPRQMLESARRAEADGNAELANQLYWHLSETHPHTAEGAEAYSSLARIGFSIAQHQQAHPQAPPPPSHMHPPAHGPAPAPAWNGGGMQGGPHAPAAYPSSPYPMPQVVTGARAEQRAALRRKLPSVRPSYGFGRAIASLVGWAGWLLVVVAVAVPAASAAGVLTKALTLPTAVLTGLALAGGGVIAVLLGQVAHAIFDQANTARELLSIERAKWGGEH